MPPDINASSYAFAVADERTIRYGLGAIKGVGRAAVEAIVEERAARGPFASLVDLCRRIDLARVSRRMLEALVRSGSLDGLGSNRASLMASLETATQAGEQAARSQEAGQVDLFGSPVSGREADVPALPSMPAAVGVPEWNASQRLAGERETLGLYLSGHPIAPYEADLRHLASGRIAEFLSERAPQPSEGGRPGPSSTPCCPQGAPGTDEAHFYFLNQRSNGLILATVFSAFDSRSQVIKIDFPPPGAVKSVAATDMEKALAQRKKVQIYGIYFDFDSSTIKPESEVVLKEISDILHKNPTWKLSVAGHTDNVGDSAFNQSLSERRAASVKNALVTEYNIAPDRLSTSGYGASQPIDTNATVEGRARNRRVELQQQ